MSGRAGRRGMDDRGIVILMVDEKMSPTVGKQLLKVTGRGVGLVRPGACLSEVWAWGGGAAQRAAAHTLLPPYPPPAPKSGWCHGGAWWPWAGPAVTPPCSPA